MTTVSDKVATAIGVGVNGTVSSHAVEAGEDFTVKSGSFARVSESQSDNHVSADKVWRSGASAGISLAVWDKGIPEQEDWSAIKKKVAVIVKLTSGGSKSNAGLILNYTEGKYLSVELNADSQEIQFRYHNGTSSTTALSHAVELWKDQVRYTLTVSVIPVLNAPEAVWIEINVKNVSDPEDKYYLGASGTLDVTVPIFKLTNYDITGSLTGYFGLIARYAESTFDEFTADNVGAASNPGLYGPAFSSAYSSAFDRGHITPPTTTNWQNPDNQWDVNDDGCITQADVDLLQSWLNTHGTAFSSAFSSAYDYDAAVLNYDQTLKIIKPAGEPYVDVNGDGSANAADLTALTSQLQQKGPICENAPWQNPANAFDVNDDGCVDADDVAILVQWLNDGWEGPLPDPKPAGYPYLDVSGDGLFSPVDLLLVITYLNTFGPSCDPEYGFGFNGAFK